MIDKILCVDDDPITLMLCRKVVARAGFAEQIDTAQNGEDALRYFDELMFQHETKYPTLVLLDLNMPIMGGWEFLDVFSKNPYAKFFKDVKIIVLSSTIDPRDVAKSKSYQAVIDFMSKPITADMLELLKASITK